MRLMNLSVGTPKIMIHGDGEEVLTGICKEAVQEVFLSKEGFQGDGVADNRHHGGPDRAVCVYSHEHYALWAEEFGIALPPAAFGENITVTNMLERDVCIGDTFQVGEAVIQVTQARVPCHTISKRTGIDGLLKRIVETGYTGFLCRVIREGVVKSDSAITLVENNAHGVSLLFTNEVYLHKSKDVNDIERILKVPELASYSRGKLEERLEKVK